MRVLVSLSLYLAHAAGLRICVFMSASALHSEHQPAHGEHGPGMLAMRPHDRVARSWTAHGPIQLLAVNVWLSRGRLSKAPW